MDLSIPPNVADLTTKLVIPLNIKAGPSRQRRREHRRLARGGGQGGVGEGQAGGGGGEGQAGGGGGGQAADPAAPKLSLLLTAGPNHNMDLPPPPPQQARRADLSSFCFKASAPSQHPPTALPRRRAPLSRPRLWSKYSLSDLRKPEKHLKVLLSQNIQKALVKNVGWVKEVSVFRLSNYLDNERVEKWPHLAVQGRLPPQNPDPPHVVPLQAVESDESGEDDAVDAHNLHYHHDGPPPLPHQADVLSLVLPQDQEGPPHPRNASLPSVWYSGELPAEEQIAQMSYEELLVFAGGGTLKQKM